MSKENMSDQQLLGRSCLGDGGTAVPMPSPNGSEHWKEFVCGGGSAFCNILFSYPLNKIIFRQECCVYCIEYEIRHLECMAFGTGTWVTNAGTQHKVIMAAFLRPKVVAIQTGLGPYHIARVGCFVVFYDRPTPTAAMMHGVEATFALNQLQKEGLTYLYRGMLPPLMQRSISMSLMFGVYDECLQPLQRIEVNSYIAKTTAGVVAGCVEATLMPFERIQTLLIHPKYYLKFRNTAHASRHIARHYGIKEFYRGLTPILLRNGPSNAMFFIIRDEIKQRLPSQDKVIYQSFQNFLSGAMIGAFLSTLFYPLNVIKVAMQCELGGPHRTILYEFRYILRKRGLKFSNFYHGAFLNITRAFLSWGIINASYEIFRKILYS